MAIIQHNLRYLTQLTKKQWILLEHSTGDMFVDYLDSLDHTWTTHAEHLVVNYKITQRTHVTGILSSKLEKIK